MCNQSLRPILRIGRSREKVKKPRLKLKINAVEEITQNAPINIFFSEINCLDDINLLKQLSIF